MTVIQRANSDLRLKPQLRLIALIKSEDIAQKILTAMHLPSHIPELHPARPPRPPPENTAGAGDWLN